MKFLTPIKQFVDSLDAREFKLYLISSLSIAVGITGGIMYRHYNSMTSMKRKIRRINNNREITQKLLGQYEHVKQQKEAVALLLAKDPTFKIVGYLNDTLASLQLAQYKASMTPTEEPLENMPGYSEVRVAIHLTGIDMKQLTECLHKLEQSERVYTKDIAITKQENTNKLDVQLTVGTLETKAVE
ncbi:hypothetical protein JW872_01140 [Candidatus Babeliales bacterium]|nr:hypothetical protein [Candidatus Babeliales bacterium]